MELQGNIIFKISQLAPYIFISTFSNIPMLTQACHPPTSIWRLRSSAMRALSSASPRRRSSAATWRRLACSSSCTSRSPLSLATWAARCPRRSLSSCKDEGEARRGSAATSRVGGGQVWVCMRRTRGGRGHQGRGMHPWPALPALPALSLPHPPAPTAAAPQSPPSAPPSCGPARPACGRGGMQEYMGGIAGGAGF